MKLILHRFSPWRIQGEQCQHGFSVARRPEFSSPVMTEKELEDFCRRVALLGQTVLYPHTQLRVATGGQATYTRSGTHGY